MPAKSTVYLNRLYIFTVYFSPIGVIFELLKQLKGGVFFVMKVLSLVSMYFR